MIQIISIQDVMDLRGDGGMRSEMVLCGPGGQVASVAVSPEQAAVIMGLFRAGGAAGAAPPAAQPSAPPVPTPSAEELQQFHQFGGDLALPPVHALFEGLDDLENAGMEPAPELVDALPGEFQGGLRQF